MARLATFADLPYEVAEYILVSIARTWAARDSASLARLARTTRPVHALVQPILTSCIVVTRSNTWTIYDIASETPDTFASTQRMLVDIVSEKVVTRDIWDDNWVPDGDAEFLDLAPITVSRSLKYFTRLVAFAGSDVHCTLVSGLCSATLKILAVTKCTRNYGTLSFPAGVSHMRVCTTTWDDLPNIVSERALPVRIMIKLSLTTTERFGRYGWLKLSRYQLPEYERVTFLVKPGSRPRKFLRRFAEITQNPKLFVAAYPHDRRSNGISSLDERTWSTGKQLYVPESSST